MSKTVLVVEDNAFLAKMYRSLLKRMELHHLVAETGQQAIDLAAETPPDLVIMDIVLPDRSGIETTHALRMLPGLENVPVIAVSTQEEQDAMEEGNGATFNARLTKPVQLETLKGVIGDFL